MAAGSALLSHGSVDLGRTVEETKLVLGRFGAPTVGCKEELSARLHTIQSNPVLANKLVKNKSRKKSDANFPTLYWDTPHSTENWQTLNLDKFPHVKVSDQAITDHLRNFRGIKAQRLKGSRMYYSRKVICPPKALDVKAGGDVDHVGTYVRTQVRRSYSGESQVYIFFPGDGRCLRAKCTCPVGVSGLCCHVICTLYLLRDVSQGKQMLVEIVCTSKLQQWHRKGTSTKFPSHQMKPIEHLPLRAPRQHRKRDAKRNVVSTYEKIVKNVAKVAHDKIPVEKHVLNVLSQSTSRESQVCRLLMNRYWSLALQDHTYATPGTCSGIDCKTFIISFSRFKMLSFVYHICYTLLCIH